MCRLLCSLHSVVSGTFLWETEKATFSCPTVKGFEWAYTSWIVLLGRHALNCRQPLCLLICVNLCFTRQPHHLLCWLNLLRYLQSIWKYILSHNITKTKSAEFRTKRYKQVKETVLWKVWPPLFYWTAFSSPIGGSLVWFWIFVKFLQRYSNLKFVRKAIRWSQCKNMILKLFGSWVHMQSVCWRIVA